jgi:hypothetical protein
MVMANGAGLTVMLSCLLAIVGVGAESVTCTVNVEVPGVVGVPEIAPVDELSDNPAGSVPTVTLQVSVPAPPLATKVSL